ncbi:MAG: response regulator transcription factor [Oscillospiraceae bacterium]
MPRIIVIDDDIAICKMIKTALTRDGHIVTTKNSAVSVSEKDFKNADLIILDIMMPIVDGITFCRENRKIIDCPILFLTAKTMENDIVDGFLAGGDDYIKKPFSITELRARVNAHIRREHRDKHQSLILENCVFDLAEKTITVKNILIAFTKSEYEICELLARNKRQIFSLESILEKVFGFNSESDVSSIRVHIKNIRNKFSSVMECPIETVWGVGYKWK